MPILEKSMLAYFKSASAALIFFTSSSLINALLAASSSVPLNRVYRFGSFLVRHFFLIHINDFNHHSHLYFESCRSQATTPKAPISTPAPIATITSIIYSLFLRFFLSDLIPNHPYPLRISDYQYTLLLDISINSISFHLLQIP